MAKRRGRKSDAIRAILAEQPAATVKEIQAALGAKRIKASVALISKLKAGANGKPHGRKSNGKAAGVVMDHLLAAKVFVGRVGSLEAARSAVAALATLIEA